MPTPGKNLKKEPDGGGLKPIISGWGDHLLACQRDAWGRVSKNKGKGGINMPKTPQGVGSGKLSGKGVNVKAVQFPGGLHNCKGNREHRGGTSRSKGAIWGQK